MPTVAITSDSQIGTGRVHTKRRTSRTQLKFRSRNLVAMAFQAERGPETVQLVANPRRFEELYGGYWSGSGKGWIAAQEKELWPLVCARSVATAAVKAAKNLANVTPTTIAVATAGSKGTWANAGTYDISDAGNADATMWKFTWYDPSGRISIWDNLNTQSGFDNLATTQGNDPALPVVLTKSANGRPLNVTGASLDTTAGTDGSIADADFTGTDRSMELIARYTDETYGVPRACFVAERSNSAIKVKWLALAAQRTDRRFIITTDASSTSASAARTDAASYRHERVIYVQNYPVIVNPATGLDLTVDPCSWRAMLIGNTSPHIHCADADNNNLLKGIKSLTQTLETTPTRSGDLDLGTDAGLTMLYTDPDGIKFFNDVTTSLTGERSGPGIAIDDDLVYQMARALSRYLNKPWDDVNELAATGDCKEILQRSFERKTGVSYFVDDNGIADKARAGYEVDVDSVNDEDTRELNEFHLLARWRRMGHWTAIVLETQSGRTVTFRKAA